VAQSVKRSACHAKDRLQEMWVQSVGCEDPLEEEMATHSSILAWTMPGTEESGWLPPMGLQRAEHDLATGQQQHITIKS
jgi:hypothetical protein